VLGIYVQNAGCRAANRLVRTYQRCLAGDCYSRVDRLCVQPVFLGRCRTRDRFFRRSVMGYSCTERRLYPIRGDYDATVTCVKGSRRIDHGYTLFASGSIAVGRESELRAAWANPRFTSIQVTRDIVLQACRLGDPIRESSGPIRLDGKGHTLRQGCFEKRLLRQDGTGFVELRNVTLTRGGSDGPGAAVTTRGEIRVIDSKVQENLSEEPGGGIMSQRRATIIRSVITGNLANDDGGGVYARRGGIQVYDSVVSSNLVDGSGGALGSTGDILVVRSHIDGNTTDGDGGAIYADEDGDVTVIDSTVDGSTADGPGGAIFTLDGDVTVVNSTVNGNRADDRGGAISGEAAVTVIDSTIARNEAVAHVGGGIWARGNLYVANSTISNNYAEGQGGGILAAGTVRLVNSTVLDNIAPVAANIGTGERLEAFGSIIGPAKTDSLGGQVQATDRNCQVSEAHSLGYNFVSDASCGLNDPTDVVGLLPQLRPLADNGGRGETLLPQPGSPVLDRIPVADCRFAEDQRGVARPQGAACDMGAVEAGP
jgi:predicted outer membrane repeat protein